jgi:enamine deaminase RidA (YjgF/YER057c/UK114 family)
MILLIECIFNNNFLTFAYTLDTIEQKLISMDIELPNPAPAAGSYVQTVKTGNLVFVAGQIPIDTNTTPPQLMFKGKVGKDISIEGGQKAARLCTLNALAQLKFSIGNLDRVKKFLKVSGFVNCDSSFTEHSKVINGASDFLVDLFGDIGKHTRVSLGMGSLPLDSAVEMDFIVEA